MNAGLSSLAWKDNTLNKYSKQDFISISLLVIVVPILKVEKNLFQTWYGSDVEWLYMHNLKNHLLFSRGLPSNIQAAISPATSA